MKEQERSLTRFVAEFVKNTSYDDIPREVLVISKNHILDGLGVALAGASQESGRIIQRYLAEIGGNAEATVIGTGIQTSTVEASLANGIAGHAMDYDDTQIAVGSDRVTGLLTHPTIPALSAALAVGEHMKCTGKEFLAAFNLGVEVECRIAEAINPEHYRRGFHSTGTIGGFGAGVAAAKLMRLSVEGIQRAMGMAGSMGAGLRANFGTMTKPFHSGRAAQNGVLAARLAQGGFGSTREILDGRWSFFRILSDGCDCDTIREGLGNPYNMISPGISIKPYPCGSLAHPTMDATLELRTEHRLDPKSIDHIEVAVASNVLDALLHAIPSNALEAKFSLPFGIGLIALKGKAGVNEYSQQVVDDPEVREFIRKVDCYVDEDIEAKGYNKMYGVVKITLHDGRVLSKDAEIARGYPEKPLSRSELAGKFTECARLSMSPERTEDLIGLVLDRLEELDDLRPLAALLSP